MATVSERAKKGAKELFADKYFRETALASNNHDDHAHAEEIAAAVIEHALLAERRLAMEFCAQDCLNEASYHKNDTKAFGKGAGAAFTKAAERIRAAAEKEVGK